MNAIEADRVRHIIREYLKFGTHANQPTSAPNNSIYVETDTGDIYMWENTAYVKIKD